MTYIIPSKEFGSKINHTLPFNYREEWSHLFKKDLAYQKVKLGVKRLSNVFVNHYGLVVKNGVLVRGCAPNIGFSNYDKNVYFKHWKKISEQFLVAKYGKSVPSKKLDDNRNYLLIHSPWFSYYFWITECIPRLLMVKEILSELVLIYPESWKDCPYVNETLALFPELQIEIIPADVHLWVKNLVLPEVKPWTPMFIPEQVNEVRSLFYSHLDKLNYSYPDTSINRVYISRVSATRRKFNDENKVISMLEKYNFTPISMEKLSFFDQISLMRQTECMVGLTGAGHINLLFMKSQGSFLDLTNIKYLNKEQYKFHYFKLCNILNINYGVSFFQHENRAGIDHYSNQNLILDDSLLANDLKKMLAYVK